jgi:hypothetical protein
MSFLGVLHRISPAVAKAARAVHTLLVKRGLWHSQQRGEPAGREGEPLPWITFPAMDYLAQLDFSQAGILEYGAGGSSLWWAARARHVISVESDPCWAERVRSRAPENLRVIGPLSGTDYVLALLEPGEKFEVIVVDGKQREACALAALDHLAEGGLLVLDNADWYPQICASLRQRGMLEVDFHGFGPVNDYTWTTSIFVRASCAVPHRGQTWVPSTHGNFVHAS